MKNATNARISDMSDEKIATELFSSIKAVKGLESNINALKAELIARGHANTVIHTSKKGEIVTIGNDIQKATDIEYLDAGYKSDANIRDILNAVALSKVLRITVGECEKHGLIDAITTKTVNPRVDIKAVKKE